MHTDGASDDKENGVCTRVHLKRLNTAVKLQCAERVFSLHQVGCVIKLSAASLDETAMLTTFINSLNFPQSSGAAVTSSLNFPQSSGAAVTSKPELSTVQWGSSDQQPELSTVQWGSSDQQPEPSTVQWGSSDQQPELSTVQWGISNQ